MKRFVHERSIVDMLHQFENKLDDVKRTTVESSEHFGDLSEWEIEDRKQVYDFDDDEESSWELEDRKDVYDIDGFVTDYTLWHNVETDEWVTVFGDHELYTPDNSDYDMEFDHNEAEAREWFENYDPEWEDDEDSEPEWLD